MARREARLEEVVVDVWGSLVTAPRDPRTGMLVCPVCRLYWAGSPEDLIAHIVSHARGYLEKLKPAPKPKD